MLPGEVVVHVGQVLIRGVDEVHPLGVCKLNGGALDLKCMESVSIKGAGEERGGGGA